MKRIAILLCCILLFASCGSDKNEILDTEGQGKSNFRDYEMTDCEGLDFWICDSFMDVDLSDYQELYGSFGAHRYVNLKYKVETVTEEGGGTYQRLPEHCVVYIVSAYPDYSDYSLYGPFVTGIDITDPEVSVFGITVNTSPEEFYRILTGKGFNAPDEYSYSESCVSSDGYYLIILEPDTMIRIIAPVENRDGIVF